MTIYVQMRSICYHNFTFNFNWSQKEVAQNILLFSKSYTGRAEAVSHEEIKSGTGLSPCNIYAAAAVMENSLTQVSTLFDLLFKQEISKLREIEKKIVIILISGH